MYFYLFCSVKLVPLRTGFNLLRVAEKGRISNLSNVNSRKAEEGY